MRTIELFRSADTQPNPDYPRRAVSLVLVRDTEKGLEVFITRQADQRGVSDRNRFSFPFSVVRPEDSRQLSMGDWTSERCARALRLNRSGRAVAFFAAAGRLALQNMGITLAEGHDLRIVTDIEPQFLHTAGKKLRDHRVSFPAVLRSRDVEFRPDLLKPWMRWVNTSWQLRRYDTVYFVCVVPPGQHVDFVSINQLWGGWMTPQEILGAVDVWEEGQGASAQFISVATRLVLESLRTVPSAAASMLKIRDLRPLQPTVLQHKGDWCISIDNQTDHAIDELSQLTTESEEEDPTTLSESESEPPEEE